MIAESEKDMNRLLKVMSGTFTAWDFKINVKKTKVLVVAKIRRLRQILN